MPLTGENAAYVKNCFNDGEWEYLQGLSRFTTAMAEAEDTLDDAERLILVGSRLVLTGWEEMRSKQRHTGL
jgi:hypothetical protein